MKTFKQFIIENNNLQHLEEGVWGIIKDIAKTAAVGSALGAGAGGVLVSQGINPLTNVLGKQTATTQPPKDKDTTTQPFTTENKPEVSSVEKKPTVLTNNLDAVERQKQAREILIQRIKDKEGFRTKAYDDMRPFTSDRKERSLNPGEEAKGKATIGYGSTFHYDENGNAIKVPHPTKEGELINKPITGGETISKEKAHHYVVSHIRNEIHEPLASKHPTIFDFKHNHDIHPAAISAFYDLAYNNGHHALTYYGPRNGRIVGDSVAKPLIAANNATDREERLHHITEALHGTLDFHKLGEPLKPSKGLIDRRWENFTHAFRSMLNDGHITQEQHDQNMERGRKRYQEILRTTGE